MSREYIAPSRTAISSGTRGWLLCAFSATERSISSKRRMRSSGGMKSWPSMKLVVKGAFLECVVRKSSGMLKFGIITDTRI